MAIPIADDFAYIRSRIAELEADKKPADEPKAWPSFTSVDEAYAPPAQPQDVGAEIWGHYSAPEADCA